MSNQVSDLKAQVLQAALACSEGDLNKTFTFEELLVEAWQRHPTAWGLRGFEHDHPDSERIHRELDSRGRKQKGLVGQGLLEKVQPRVYRLTPKGIAVVGQLMPDEEGIREQVDRILAHEIGKTLDHPTFKDWLKDPEQPNRFRNAGSFWGVAAGTPPSVIRQRILKVDHTLNSALILLDRMGVDEIGDRRGRVLFERADIERCLEFHECLKNRFSGDLGLLGLDLAN